MLIFITQYYFLLIMMLLQLSMVLLYLIMSSRYTALVNPMLDKIFFRKPCPFIEQNKFEKDVLCSIAAGIIVARLNSQSVSGKIY